VKKDLFPHCGQCGSEACRDGKDCFAQADYHKSLYEDDLIAIGFHAVGWHMGKAAAPMNRCTQWDILPSNHWCSPGWCALMFLPPNGWVVRDKFGRSKMATKVGADAV